MKIILLPVRAPAACGGPPTRGKPGTAPRPPINTKAYHAWRRIPGQVIPMYGTTAPVNLLALPLVEPVHTTWATGYTNQQTAAGRGTCCYPLPHPASVRWMYGETSPG